MKKKVLIVLLGVITSLLILILSVNIWFSRSPLKDYIFNKIEKRVGYAITSQTVGFSIWRGPEIVLKGLEIRERDGKEVIFLCKKIRIELDGKELLHGRFQPSHIILYRPLIRVGAKKGEGGAFPLIPAERVTIIEGDIEIAQKGLGIEGISAQIRIDGEKILLNSQGKLVSHRWKINGLSFDIQGEGDLGKGRLKWRHIKIKGEDLNLGLIPFKKGIRFKRGALRGELDVVVAEKGGYGLTGEIEFQRLLFSINRRERKKEYSFDKLLFKIKGRFKDGELDLPDIILYPFKEPLRISLFYRQGKAPFIRLKVISSFIPFSEFKRIIPTPYLPRWVEEKLLPSIRDGKLRLNEFSLTGSPSQIKGISRNGNRDILSMDLEFTGLDIRYPDLPLPFRNVDAKLRLKGDELLISSIDGNYGNSVIKDSVLSIEGLWKKKKIYRVKMDSEFFWKDLMVSKDVPFLPSSLKRILGGIENAKGRLLSGLTFTIAGREGIDFSRLEISSKGSEIRYRRFPYPFRLEELNITLKDKRLKITGKVNFKGASSRLDATIDMRGGKSQIRDLRMKGMLHSEMLNEIFKERLGVGIYFKQSMPFFISLKREREFYDLSYRMGLRDIKIKKGSADLTLPEAELSLNLKVDKRGRIWSAGGRYQASHSEILFKKIAQREWWDIKITRLDLRRWIFHFKNRRYLKRGYLSGEIKIAGSKMVDSYISLTDIDMGYEDIPLILKDIRFSIKRRDGPYIMDIKKAVLLSGKEPLYLDGSLEFGKLLKGRVELRGRRLYVKRLSSIFKGKGKGELKSELFLGISIDELTVEDLGSGKFELLISTTPQSTHIERLIWEPQEGSFRLQGDLLSPTSPLNIRIWVREKDIEDLNRVIPINTGFINGTVSGEVFLIFKGKGKEEILSNLGGKIKILLKKGKIKKSNIFIKILDFLSLQNILKGRLPSFGSAFPFDSLIFSGKIERGVLYTEKFFLKSPPFDAVGKGSIDLRANTLDAEMGIRPFQSADSILSKIPVVGYIITGKDRAFVTYYFKVKGPLKDPDVKYIPLTKTAKGLIDMVKRLFTTPLRLLEKFGLPPSEEKEGEPEEEER